MLARLNSGTIIGLAGVCVEVEVDVAKRGFPTFSIVGLPDKAIDESKDRVRTAIINSNFEMPDSRITVNLAPADIPKIGSGFDLPIALGVLAASGRISQLSLQESLFIGELSLHGHLRPVQGMISIALMAKERELKILFVPSENAEEASSIGGLEVYPVNTLHQLIQHLNGKELIQKYIKQYLPSLLQPSYEFDYGEIKGQDQAKRALQIAAAGFHNIHLQGVPGAGKTMLCRALPSILPPLHTQELLEVSKIYSATGMQKKGMLYDRPFRSPHHTTSKIGLIGGGAVPSPGEISLAHRGVLFLDEIAEFPRSTLEALRQPLEDGSISISRASGSLTFPSRFLLLAASNPCPCGFYGTTQKKCTCSHVALGMYQKKLSGPLLDRIELHVTIHPVQERTLSDGLSVHLNSKTLKEQVLLAYEVQRKRFSGLPITSNGEMSTAQIKRFCTIRPDAQELLSRSVSRLGLSARSYFKTIKVAQTIADLEHKESIEQVHISEALQYRKSTI